jgi:hypothetical protein
MPTLLDQADQEIDGLASLVLLMPEDRWTAFVGLVGEADGDTARYRGVTFRKAPVTAIVPEEGF